MIELEEKRRVRVLCLSGEKNDCPSDSLEVVIGVEVEKEKDVVGAAKARRSAAAPLQIGDLMSL